MSYLSLSLCVCVCVCVCDGQVIKLYAWEIPFKKLIMDIRRGELSTLRKSAYLNAGFSFTWTCAPFLVCRCV